MIKKILLILLSILFLNLSFSLTGDGLSGTNCEDISSKFLIEGPSVVKEKKEVLYKVNNLQDNNVWKIIKNGKIVYTYTGTNFKYAFQKAGNVKLEVNFNYENCNVVVNKNISIYKTIILSIKHNKVSFIPYEQLKQKNIYFKNISFDNLKSNKYFLDIADYVIIDQKYIIDFFSKYSGDYDNKKFILLISSFKGFYSKFIIPYVKNIYKNNIYVYDPGEFLNILDHIYQGNQLDKKNLFIVSSVGDKVYFPLSYFVNKLIENGVNIEQIGLILLALFGIIVIAIFRQVIGFSVFGVYTPLLFVVLIMLVGYNITLLLFLISLIANIVTYLITKKIYILYSSKIALNYILYVILTILIIGLLLKYGLISLSNINSSIILTFFIMPLLSKNLVKEETNIFSKNFWLFVFEFFIISFILFLIFHFDTLKYILIAYPDLLWLFVILAILVGRFSGLQLLEYIRFYPLIKKGFYEEE